MNPIEQPAPLAKALQQPYRHGFETDIETDALPPGLDEDIIRAISRRKREPEFLLKWRLAAFERWQKMPMPEWGKLRIAPIDFQALCYYSAPKSLKDGPKSLAEVDPKLLETYEKLNVPLHELWPDRYYPDGSRIDRRTIRYREDNKRLRAESHRLNAGAG